MYKWFTIIISLREIQKKNVEENYKMAIVTINDMRI